MVGSATCWWRKLLSIRSLLRPPPIKAMGTRPTAHIDAMLRPAANRHCLWVWLSTASVQPDRHNVKQPNRQNVGAMGLDSAIDRPQPTYQYHSDRHTARNRTLPEIFVNRHLWNVTEKKFFLQNACSICVVADDLNMQMERVIIVHFHSNLWRQLFVVNQPRVAGEVRKYIRARQLTEIAASLAGKWFTGKWNICQT